MNTTGTWLLLRKFLAYEIYERIGHCTRSCAGSSYSTLFIIHLRNTINLKLVIIVFAKAHLSSILYIILSLPCWFLAQSLLGSVPWRSNYQPFKSPIYFCYQTGMFQALCFFQHRLNHNISDFQQSDAQDSVREHLHLPAFK